MQRVRPRHCKWGNRWLLLGVRCGDVPTLFWRDVVLPVREWEHERWRRNGVRPLLARECSVKQWQLVVHPLQCGVLCGCCGAHELQALRGWIQLCCRSVGVHTLHSGVLFRPVGVPLCVMPSRDVEWRLRDVLHRVQPRNGERGRVCELRRVRSRTDERFGRVLCVFSWHVQCHCWHYELLAVRSGHFLVNSGRDNVLAMRGEYFRGSGGIRVY